MASDRPTLPPGMRAQLGSSSYMGVPTFGLRPHLTEPEGSSGRGAQVRTDGLKCLAPFRGTRT
jgi:hypothetical protein